MRQLVIGGVRLHYQRRMRLQKTLQMRRFLRIVVNHGVVIELHARLHHERNHALPRRIQSSVEERFAMYSQRLLRCFRARHFKPIERMRRPAGHRHFRPDHIDHRHKTEPRTCILCGLTQCSGTLSHQFIGKNRGIVRTTHAGIEMDLRKPGFYIQPNHFQRVLHGGSLHRASAMGLAQGDRRQESAGSRRNPIAPQCRAHNRETLRASYRCNRPPDSPDCRLLQAADTCHRQSPAASPLLLPRDAQSTPSTCRVCRERREGNSAGNPDKQTPQPSQVMKITRRLRTVRRPC